ncbi:MAG TPA: DUF4159 domain-containing protein [Blastocatellia bacterium]|nr:DUF4159 domain-containing protein [Blastocatellia bacterium]
MRKLLSLIPLLLLLAAPVVLSAPPAANGFKYDDERLGERKDVSDKFTFVRVILEPTYPGMPLGDRGEWWSHDYPEAGHHFSKILSELSKLQVNLDMDEYIFSFEDPNLFKYPFAYMCEPGYMRLSEGEIKGMREYLLRGGFLLVDDFRGYPHLQNFLYHMKQALPEYEVKELDISHPIFNCFFSIKTLDVRPPYGGGRPQFLGVEDRHGRLMMVINYNNDVSDYWQWSNDPNNPIEETNTAYKFGVNYVFYALTR